MLLIAPPPQAYDIWRDPIWQFIGVLVAILLGFFGVAGFIITVKAYRQQNKRKELTYQVEVDTPLVSVDKTLKKEVEIRYRGNMVENVRLVLIKVWNSGSLAVRREDYVVPIEFEITGRQCLDTQVNCEPQEIIRPEDLNDFLKLEPDYLKLSPVLLNPADKTTPADTMTLKLLVSGRGKIKGTARIIEGKLIEFNPDKQSKTVSYLQLTGGMVILATFIAFLIFSLVAPSLMFSAQTVRVSSAHELTLSPFASIIFGLIIVGVFLIVLTKIVGLVMRLVAEIRRSG